MARCFLCTKTAEEDCFIQLEDKKFPFCTTHAGEVGRFILGTSLVTKYLNKPPKGKEEDGKTA
jgi:hypothetical protein